jgi:uncharacterized protein (TIGR03435 family)
MMRALIEDRFHMRTHRETKEMPVYALTISRGGSKLKPAIEGSKIRANNIAGVSVPIPQGKCAVIVSPDGPHLIGKAATLSQMAASLSRWLDSAVTDGSGLQGSFDFDVLFARDDHPSDTGLSLAPALQRALGLKLERGKAPLELLVIDHFEKPSAN